MPWIECVPVTSPTTTNSDDWEHGVYSKSSPSRKPHIDRNHPNRPKRITSAERQVERDIYIHIHIHRYSEKDRDRAEEREDVRENCTTKESRATDEEEENRTHRKQYSHTNTYTNKRTNTYTHNTHHTTHTPEEDHQKHTGERERVYAHVGATIHIHIPAFTLQKYVGSTPQKQRVGREIERQEMSGVCVCVCVCVCV
jgi:hypothetical protein